MDALFYTNEGISGLIERVSKFYFSLSYVTNMIQRGKPLMLWASGALELA